jgi:hypothetical protein
MIITVRTRAFEAFVGVDEDVKVNWFGVRV